MEKNSGLRGLWFGGLGFRVWGFRALGFGGLGFRAWGFRALGFRGRMFRYRLRENREYPVLVRLA